MTTPLEDEKKFRIILDTNTMHPGRVSDAVLNCIHDAGYNLKLIKIEDIKETRDANYYSKYIDNQILLEVNLGNVNSVIREATLEFKIKNYPYVIKKLLKVISQELEDIK